jgi:glycosyltransferase involved in cell wall biosynthesis
MTNLLRSEFFLCVGTIEPRKNQMRVVAAFNHFWANGGRLGVVFVGRLWRELESEFRDLAGENFGNRLFHFENISDSELIWLYKNAYATIQVSSYEGFGLPVIESISYGKPVIVNSYGVQNELAMGNGGLSTADQSIESLASAIERIASDKVLLATLVKQAQEAKFFNIDEYATELSEVLARIELAK